MSERILIADDNPTFRKTLRHLLEGSDRWEIIETENGQEAVTKSAETRPNLILLDLAMPVKDGLAAAREISELLPSTPILMCTMHHSAQLDTEAKKCGIRQVLSKSDGNLILAAIQQWISPHAVRTHKGEPTPVELAPVALAASDTTPQSVVSPPTAAESAAASPAESPKTPA